MLDFIIELEPVQLYIDAASAGGAVMQTVWSRVAQARCVCNCPSCVLTTNAVARRATTATARRTIRVGDVFTVSISSLAAGLAFADSRKKDNRRKQWEKVIGEARARLEATEIQQQSRLAALSDEVRAEAQEKTRVAGHHVTTERAIKEVAVWGVEESEEQDQRFPIPDDGTDTWLDVFDWAREQQNLREASGFQDWKGPPLSLLQSLSRAQLCKLLFDKRLLRRFYGEPESNSLVDEQSRYPFSMKKIRTLEWSIAKMVLKLLTYCSRNHSDPGENLGCHTNCLLRELFEDDETLQSKLAHIEQRLRILKGDRWDRRSRLYYKEFETPQIPNYDDTTIEEYEKTKYEQTTEMNTSLRKLLGGMKHDADLSDLMSKICYNLLTARTPPNIHTYNMLFVRFCVLDKDNLVRTVLTSMRESHIRPNEVTHATLLRYFTATGNRFGFVEYLGRMEGFHGGLALAHPEQKIHPVLKERYRIFGQSHDKAAEKGRMNDQVYESLIVGALKYLGGQTAMYYYRNMISEGWSPGLGISLAILQDCCHRLDWTVGAAVLEQLEKTAERMTTLTYEWMLRLCQCCGQQEVFDQILRNGVFCGALPASILDLPDHAKVEDVDFLIERAKDLQPRKAIGTLEETAARMTYHLSEKSPFLLENIFHDCEDEDMLCNTINRTNHMWKAMLALQNRLDIISIDINHTVLQANHVLHTLNSKNLSSVKFWLSRRVIHLEKEFEQNVNSVAYDSSRDVMRDGTIQRTQERRGEDGEGESSNSVDLTITTDITKTEVKNEEGEIGNCTDLPITAGVPKTDAYDGEGEIDNSMGLQIKAGKPENRRAEDGEGGSENSVNPSITAGLPENKKAGDGEDGSDDSVNSSNTGDIPETRKAEAGEDENGNSMNLPITAGIPENRTAEDGEDESGNSMNLSITAGIPENEAKCASRLPPRRDRQQKLVQSSPPSPTPIRLIIDRSPPIRPFFQRIQRADDYYHILLAKPTKDITQDTPCNHGF